VNGLLPRLGRRLLVVAASVLLVHGLAFLALRAVPGGPFDTARPLAPEVRAALEARYGLDAPLHAQYLSALRGLLTGDFGPSLHYRDVAVRTILADALPVSLWVGGLALLLAFPLGAGCGVAAAMRRRLEGPALGASALLLAVPNFVLAGLFVLAFSFGLGWLPPAGWGGARHVVLPALCLALPLAAQVFRVAHEGARAAHGSPAVRFARAMGLPPRTLARRHVLRPALVPVAAFLAPASAGVLTGSLVVERVFALPGLGTHFVRAAMDRDYTLALGATVVYTALLGLCTLLGDLLLAVLDPRVEAVS